MQFNAKQIEDIVSQVLQQMSNPGYVQPEMTFANDASQLGSGGMEPFDKDYSLIDYGPNQDRSPYPRINRLLQRVHNTKTSIDHERAVLVTEAYQMYEGEPQVIKCAKVLAHVLKNVSLRIYPDEVIIGEIAAPSRSAPIFPEFSFAWIADELKNYPMWERKSDIMQANPETVNGLLKIEDYWKGKTVQEYAECMLTEEEIKGSSAGGRPVFHPNQYMYFGVGHTASDWETLFARGYGGLKRSIEENLAALDLTVPGNVEKREFYKAQLIALDGVKAYFTRYADLARQTARAENGERKQELLQIADNCDWISENPPRSFWEAVQLMHLATNIILIESSGQGIGYGRFDQVLYPFYENDMKQGTLSKRFAAEIIENFFIKLYELMKLRDRMTAILNSEIGMGGTTLILGGVDRDGKDAVNDLSYLSLEAHAHTQLPDPWFSVRWHANSPWEYKVKCVNVIRMGTGQPKIFNDEVHIPISLQCGRTLEDSRNYSIIGCVEPDVNGIDYGATDSAYFSIGKVLELAINDGRCTDCGPQCTRWERCGAIGEKLGPSTGSLANFKSFDEVLQAYEIQMEYWVDKCVSFLNVLETVHARMKPVPYLSLLIRGCIDKGIDASGGGAKYNHSGIQCTGNGTVADGLCTIKQLIFEEKRITGEQLLDALKKNWKGYETLYALVNSDRVHHFGNNDPYADELAAYASEVYCNNVRKHKLVRGNGDYRPALFSVSANVGIGLCQGASADGRLDMEPVSNCLGPVHTKVGCHDVNGPTAMAMSAAKIDQGKAINGTLLNVRFTPSCVSGEAGRDNMIHFIESYFQNKGAHCQFNVVSNEILRDAQIHPEKYPSLLVRVAGYSAYFVRLSKELQDDLIGRNEYSSFD